MKHQKNLKLIVKVDFTNRLLFEGYHLKRNGDYNYNNIKSYFGGPEFKRDNFTTQYVEDVLVYTIEKTLKRSLDDEFDFEVDIIVEEINDGSIELVVAVVGTLYAGISKYKNFIDGCLLIRSHTKSIVRSVLEKTFGKDIFDVSVKITNMPSEPNELTKLKKYFFILLGTFLFQSVLMLVILAVMILKLL